MSYIIFILSLSIYLGRIPYEEHDIVMKKFRARTRWISVKVSVIILLYTLFPNNNIIHVYINSDNLFSSSYIFFNFIIFNTCIIFIWLNPMYIMPEFCRMTVPLSHYCVINNYPLYLVSYLYAASLLIVNWSPTLYSWTTLLPFL